VSKLKSIVVVDIPRNSMVLPLLPAVPDVPAVPLVPDVPDVPLVPLNAYDAVRAYDAVISGGITFDPTNEPSFDV